MVNAKTLREITPLLPFTLKLNRDLKPEDWKDMDQLLKLHKLLKDLFQQIIEHKRFNMDSHWAEKGEGWQKIFLREISFKELMEITKDWNSNRKFKLLEDREAKIRKNESTMQAIEEKWSQKENIMTPSGSHGVGQPNSPVASHHSDSSKSRPKSHHSSQFQEVSRRRQESNGKNKITFSQRNQ
ncbi:hypothetical protein O181_000199 [Austropuccinia psidii MF-1]|uniref:Uncharacterized protein n=1 Tax=Austropuccinia psidii MF-1 TaxID=1389203 RepID=A0A9Q3B867_9BASI|nr:hypothetical protein [Austropuccinia psidii MF-1]